MVPKITLNDICEKKVQMLSSQYDGEIEYIDISSINNERKTITSTQTINAKEAPSRAKQLIQYGDILISTVRPNLNAIALVEKESDSLLVASTGYCVLRCYDRVDKHYVFHFCQSPAFVDKLASQATGASYPAVTNAIVKKCLIPLPSIAEQHKISAILDKVNDLITLRKQQLAKLDELVKARFVEMFGDPETNPMQWGIVNISEVIAAKVSNGFFAKRDAYCDDGNIQVLGVANIVNRMYSNINNLPRTNGSEGDIAKYSVKYGDMLFCRSSLVEEGIGKASIVPHNVPTNVLFECHVIRLPLNLTKCVPEFMQVLSTTKFFRKQIIAQSKTATMTTIGQDGILKTQIILPPLELQNGFLRFIEKIQSSKLTIQQSLDKLEVLKKALMQEYFG